MKRVRKIISLIILSGTVIGCSKVSFLKKTQGKEYPEGKYLKAQGIGQTESEARNQALSELSRIFESKVQSDTSDRVKAVIDESGEKYTQKIESRVRVISKVDLVGAKIINTWMNKKNKNYYAQAVLEKRPARDRWAQEMDDLDSQMEGEYRNFTTQTSNIIKLKSAQKIIDAWVRRESIRSHIRVLGYNYAGSSGYDIRQIFTKLPHIKASMAIFVTIKGTHAQDVWDQLTKALNQKGYGVISSREKADVVIEGVLRDEKVDLNNPGWEYARVNLSVKILDEESGTTVGEFIENTRIAQRTYEEAVFKGMRKIFPSVMSKIMTFLE